MMLHYNEAEEVLLNQTENLYAINLSRHGLFSLHKEHFYFELYFYRSIYKKGLFLPSLNVLHIYLWSTLISYIKYDF